MKQAIVNLQSQSPYSQGKHYEVPKLSGESHADYEVRTWRNRMHVMETGQVQIPPLAFCNSVKTSAQRLSIKIPGGGQRTYTKAFESGLMVLEPLILPYLAADVPSDCLFVPSDGKKGSGSRVTKYFPRIDSWAGQIRFILLDDTITKEVFERVVHNAGLLVGIGVFRPERGGYYGRFAAQLVSWDVIES